MRDSVDEFVALGQRPDEAIRDGHGILW